MPSLTRSDGIRLAIALNGTGWHPASWRAPHARAAEIFTGTYWADQALAAERALADFVTFEDSLALQGTTPLEPGTVPLPSFLRGRLDATLLASWVATRTERIGLVPTVTTTHTEPFHVSKALATLDHVSGGRAGWRVQVSATAAESAHVGRHPYRDPRTDETALLDLFEEAAEVVETVRRLWDSWEDDAEIRDAATGRFVDRDKLHYVDVENRFFSVRGPSITPRPPQGQPVVAALAHATVPYELAARSADVVLVTPTDEVDAARIVTEVRAAEAAHRTSATPLLVLADLEVALDTALTTGAGRRAALDRAAGRPYASDAHVVGAPAAEVADLIERWHAAGVDGFRLRPAEHAIDIPTIASSLVPLLQERGLLPVEARPGTLRERLALPEAPNRYAAA